jgi:hypothetical protein
METAANDPHIGTVQPHAQSFLTRWAARYRRQADNYEALAAIAAELGLEVLNGCAQPEKVWQGFIASFPDNDWLLYERDYNLLLMEGDGRCRAAVVVHPDGIKAATRLGGNHDFTPDELKDFLMRSAS